MPTQTQLVAALARHAHYEQPSGVPSAHLPHPLTPKGEQQATALADVLDADTRRHGWALHTTVFCSSLLRAWQTATLASARLTTLRGQAFRVVERDALAERSVGAAANLTVSEIERMLSRDPRHAAPASGWKERSDYRLPLIGAESLEQAGARVAASLRESLAEVRASSPSGETVVVFVGHGAAFRHAAAQLGALDRALVGTKSMHHALPVYLTTDDAQPWRLVAGAWKDRTQSAVD